jgi:hypothetical protein
LRSSFESGKLASIESVRKSPASCHHAEKKTLVIKLKSFKDKKKKEHTPPNGQKRTMMTDPLLFKEFEDLVGYQKKCRRDIVYGMPSHNNQGTGRGRIIMLHVAIVPK